MANGSGAIHAKDTDVEILDREGRVLAAMAGSKQMVADGILQTIEEHLIQPRAV